MHDTKQGATAIISSHIGSSAFRSESGAGIFNPREKTFREISQSGSLLSTCLAGAAFLQPSQFRSFDNRCCGPRGFLAAIAVALSFKVNRVPLIATIGRLEQRQGVPPCVPAQTEYARSRG